MFKKTLISFAFVAISIASAATFKVTLVDASIVKGTDLKAGDYQLNLKDNPITLVHGKKQVEVPAKVENSSEKYVHTRVLYSQVNGKLTIREIQLGGTTTKLTFANGVPNRRRRVSPVRESVPDYLLLVLSGIASESFRRSNTGPIGPYNGAIRPGRMARGAFQQ